VGIEGEHAQTVEVQRSEFHRHDDAARDRLSVPGSRLDARQAGQSRGSFIQAMVAR